MRERQKRSQMLQWHPAFYAGIQIEFSEEADKLLFENEHLLGTKPKAIDVLILKRDPEETLHKNIGKIFRTHNIMEYKRPGDHLSINDYYKVLGYACFYKADTPRENAIQVSDITVSFVCHRRPLKLLKHLTVIRHLELTEQEKGIFHVTGDIYPVQIICTSRLSPESNLWLKSLTDDLRPGDTVDRLLEEYRRHQKNVLYKSVMDIIIRANRELFKEGKDKMCEALRELFKDELEVGIAAGIEERLPKAVEERLPKAIEERLPKAIEERLPKAIEERMPKAIEERMPKAIEERMPKAIEERMTEILQKVQQEITQKVQQESINTLIADNIEEGFSIEKILGKLEKRFGLTPKEARVCLEQFTS